MDGGGAADVGGVGTVEGADAVEAAQDIGKVAAEHAAVGVDLVDDHILEVFEQFHPFGVVGKDALMEHVGVCHHHMTRLTDGRAGGSGRVAVIGEGFDVRAQRLDHGVQFRHLIGRQRFGGEQVQRAGGVVLQNRRQHGQVVAQGLARRGGGDHHKVFALKGVRERLCLMGVQPLDAAVLEDLYDAPVQFFGEISKRCRPLRYFTDAGDILHE